MRIGIFGGTFNPPHEGHKKLALEFSGRLSLDLILVIPTCSPPHKTVSNLASADDRLEMCKLCFKDKSTPFIVSNIEICRSGKSYTVDTLKMLKEVYPNNEILMLIGEDMLECFGKWRSPREIVSLATVCYMRRRGEGRLWAAEREFEKLCGTAPRFIGTEPLVLSSSEIREKLTSKEKVAELLPDSVYGYIKEKGLYK